MNTLRSYLSVFVCSVCLFFGYHLYSLSVHRIAGTAGVFSFLCFLYPSPLSMYTGEGPGALDCCLGPTPPHMRDIRLMTFYVYYFLYSSVMPNPHETGSYSQGI